LRAGFYEKAIGQEMNLASGVETKIIDLATMINDITENQAGIVFSTRRKWDTKSRLLASIDRAKELLGYEPKTSFRDGLGKTIQWFRDHWELVKSSASFEPGASSAVRGIDTTTVQTK
jgi:nucleoside-diphosphate-sugar epimerase